MPLLINGQRIDDALVDGEFSSIKAYHESLGNISCCERDPEFRQMAIDNISGRVLLAQEAARALPPSPEADVEQAVNKVIDEYGGKDWFFMRTGATEEQMPLVRRDVDIDLRVKRMLDALADEGSPPTDADLRAHYDAHLKLFMTDEQVRASHILKTPRGEDKYETYDLLRRLRKELQNGADFETLAKAHSDRAEDAIDLGFFKKGELAPEFESVAFSLAVGEISPIFLSQFGHHLITVTERKPAEPKPFEEVKEEVRQHWWQSKRDARTKELVEKLKTQAKIEEIDAEVEAAAAMA